VMCVRPFFARLIKAFLAFVVCAAGLTALTLTSADTAQACNPCECENDRRHNCMGGQFYAVYTKGTPTGCLFEVYSIAPNGTGRRQLRFTERDLARFPAKAQNYLVATGRDKRFALYRLASGEWQVNAGPDEENKVYVTIIRDCPASAVREEVFIMGK
jgi:hypothetical protein